MHVATVNAIKLCANLTVAISNNTDMGGVGLQRAVYR